MKVLGVFFDSKLNWQTCIQMAFTKAHKALQAIKLISPYFNKTELMSLAISNYYSILYYNSHIWLLPSLSRQSKISLLCASSAPLKICCKSYHTLMSYECLHSILKRPLPQAITKHNHAQLPYKI